MVEGIEVEEAQLALTKEEVEMLGIILTGGLVSMDRMASAELYDIFGEGQTKKCPFCQQQVEEDAEHMFWACPEWAGVMAAFIEQIQLIIGGMMRPDRIAAPGKRPKWIHGSSAT